MMYLRKNTSIIAVFIALCAYFPTLAIADGMLEEVVVTAQKRSQNLQDDAQYLAAYS